MPNLRKVQGKSGQRLVSLPKEARKALDVDAGDYVTVESDGSKVIVRAARIVVDGEGVTP